MLQRLELVDFRNFERAVLVLGPRFTVLAGHNGAGKTNALEAIWLLATLRSFRVAELAPLVRRGANVASVGVTVFDAALGLPSELSVPWSGSATYRTVRPVLPRTTLIRCTKACTSGG